MSEDTRQDFAVRPVVNGDVDHGNRGGGPLHNTATKDVAGFMSAADKKRLDVNQIGTYVKLSGPTSMGTGTTLDILGIPTTYRTLMLVFSDVSHTDTVTAQRMLSALSGNGGSSYGSANNICDTYLGSSQIQCILYVHNASESTVKFTTSNQGYYGWNRNPSNVPVNAIRISLSSGNFDGGTVTVYGGY